MERSSFAARGAGRMSVIAVLATAFLLLAATVVVAQEGEGQATGTAVSTATCLSGMKWTSGNSGSPEMHPGYSCIDCHSAGEGPKYLVAGTVYQKFDESNDCYGVEGAVVQLTDAKGQVIKLTTNKAGNFFLPVRNNSITFPVKAKVIIKDKERAMVTAQSTGNCMGCHTSKGLNNAPGRIIIPSG